MARAEQIVSITDCSLPSPNPNPTLSPRSASPCSDAETDAGPESPEPTIVSGIGIAIAIAIGIGTGCAIGSASASQSLSASALRRTKGFGSKRLVCELSQAAGRASLEFAARLGPLRVDPAMDFVLAGEGCARRELRTAAFGDEAQERAIGRPGDHRLCFVTEPAIVRTGDAHVPRGPEAARATLTAIRWNDGQIVRARGDDMSERAIAWFLEQK